LEQLSAVINVPPSVLRKRIEFWQTQGIICKKAENIFTLADKTNANDIEMHSQTHDMCEESANDQREEELQVFWSYCFGMLIILDSLPLEQIHQMHKVLVLSFHRKS
jgi:anaphase-promoting complex subunit 2